MTHPIGITEDSILSLEGHQVFVFGSNDAGRHGRGAAKTALSFGAIYGQGEGRQGNCYGIPTKDWGLKPKLLFDIQTSVNRFLDYVKNTPEKYFLLTQVGCGLAGFTVPQIAPLFYKGLDLPNLSFPKEFLDYYRLSHTF